MLDPSNGINVGLSRLDMLDFHIMRNVSNIIPATPIEKWGLNNANLFWGTLIFCFGHFWTLIRV